MRRLINTQPKDPETGRVPPEASAMAMTIGAFLTPLGQLVFAWTCVPATIHWAVPIAAGIPFGAGNTLSFIYGANYLAGAYGNWAASALAGNAVLRSVFGGTLPLAGPAMYARLTPQWAGTLCGLLEVALIPIPFVFYRYGKGIRARSKLIAQLRADQAKQEGRGAKGAGRQGGAAGNRGVGVASAGEESSSSGARVEHDLVDAKAVSDPEKEAGGLDLGEKDRRRSRTSVGREATAKEITV